MSRSPKKRAKMSAFEIKATIVFCGALVVYALGAMWLGYRSPIYAECLNTHDGRGAAFFCSLSLLGGGPFDYLIFAGQWTPLVAFFVWLKFGSRREEERRAARRIKDRARRAARKTASQSSSILSE